MIDTKELMKGNYVQNNGGLYVIDKIDVTHNDVNVYHLDSGKLLVDCPCEDFEYVEITAERLDGLKELKANKFQHQFPNWEFRLENFQNIYIEYIEYNGENFDVCADAQEIVYIDKFLHIHQLQNLFKVLTGKDLM